jgi:hypothetical protein
MEIFKRSCEAHARSLVSATKDHDRPVFFCIVDFRVRTEVSVVRSVHVINVLYGDSIIYSW